MCVIYLGLLIIISQNKGSTYIVSELNGSVFNRPIAAFQVIPYFAHQHIDIPPLDELIDISARRLCELENLTAAYPMVMTSLMKKILLWTCQMAAKTEDSLVFSWEGRHIPFILFYFRHLS